MLAQQKSNILKIAKDVSPIVQNILNPKTPGDVASHGKPYHTPCSTSGRFKLSYNNIISVY
jgi:hypothetical protein